MKYLVIGDANSMHIYNYTKNFLLPRGYEIHLLTLSVNPVKESYKDFYKQNGVMLHSVAEKNYKGLNKTDKFHRILNLLRKLWLMHDVPKVDVCHLQSVYKTSVMMARLFKQKHKKLILSYWGGDLLEKDPKIIKLIKKCLNRADCITVTVKHSLELFKIVYGNEFDNKLQVCRFATAGIDCINEIEKTQTLAECRESYNIPKDKICITCGYSAYREQHQDRCLEIIGTLPKELKEKIDAEAFICQVFV